MTQPLLLIKSPESLNHLTGYGVPEIPSRYTAIETAIASIAKKEINAREATIEEIKLCHTPEYIDSLRLQTESIPAGNCAYLKEDPLPDTRLSSGSWKAALHAVGAILDGVDALINKTAKRIFCLVRPPGHHACSGEGMGFCLFNNAAIGALYALKQGFSRVLIADWDAHHGNGTEEIVTGNKSIFYFSTHQSPAYPGTGVENHDNIINIPVFPDPDARLKIIEAFEKQLVEAMETFKPDLVIISCGFDAREDDPICNLNLTDEDFGKLTQIVRSIADRHADGRIISILEGGYNLEGIAKAAKEHLTYL